MLWQMLKQGDVFSVLDMRRLPRFTVAFRKWNLGILNSDVWVPLMRGGEVLGILTLGICEDGTQIPENQFAFLQEIAAVAATNMLLSLTCVPRRGRTAACTRWLPQASSCS